MMLRPGFFVALVGVVIFAGSAKSHAETNAEKVFGHWQSVTVQTIRQPVPEFVYSGSPLGSVQRYNAQPVPEFCPVYDGSEVVGFTTHCPAITGETGNGQIPSAPRS